MAFSTYFILPPDFTFAKLITQFHKFSIFIIYLLFFFVKHFLYSNKKGNQALILLRRASTGLISQYRKYHRSGSG